MSPTAIRHQTTLHSSLRLKQCTTSLTPAKNFLLVHCIPNSEKSCLTHVPSCTSASGSQTGSKLTSPHRGIALRMMLASWPTSQWISTVRGQIAVKRCIASQRWCSVMHIALHKLFVLVPSEAPTPHDSQHGLQSISHLRVASSDLANLDSKAMSSSPWSFRHDLQNRAITEEVIETSCEVLMLADFLMECYLSYANKLSHHVFPMPP